MSAEVKDESDEDSVSESSDAGTTMNCFSALMWTCRSCYVNHCDLLCGRCLYKKFSPLHDAYS